VKLRFYDEGFLLTTEQCPLLSICIPAYNRSEYLPQLLESIFCQDLALCEVVICEDNSPQRAKIREIVRRYTEANPNVPIKYVENNENLGFDGNLRNLIELASGTYVMFMGNDDLLLPDAVRTVKDVLLEHPEVGYIFRAYSWFRVDPSDPADTIQYFPGDRYFNPCPSTVVTLFRRAGVLSGLVLHRKTCLKFATDTFDGSLYYQLHLVGNVALEMPSIYINKPLVTCRSSDRPEFGNSNAERGVHTPGRYTWKARISMLSGMLRIAKYIEESHSCYVYKGILDDIGNYFYPYVRDQESLSIIEYIKYYSAACRLGFWRNPLFHLYFAATFMFKRKIMDRVVKYARERLIYSARLGKINIGKAITVK